MSAGCFVAEAAGLVLAGLRWLAELEIAGRGGSGELAGLAELDAGKSAAGSCSGVGAVGPAVHAVLERLSC